MDFTEIYKQSAGLVAFSAGAHWILCAAGDHLIVRRADELQITRSWQVNTSPSATVASFGKAHTSSGSNGSPSSSSDVSITHIGWSCDSEYILAACAKRGIVNVYKMRDDTWTARIEAGAEGLTRAEWAPDGRTIVCFSEWGLRVTLWSLVTGNATHIQFPKHPDRGYTFRRDGRYFILAERHKSKDTIGVYDAGDSYKLVRHYPVPTTSLASLAISPTGNNLAVWDGPLEYKLCIFTLTGTHLSTFSPTPDPGLGIRCVSWHPSGSFVAIGGYDDKIYILDSLSWSAVTTLELSNKIPAAVTVWREPMGWMEATLGRGFLSYESLKGTQTVPIVRPDFTKAHPKSGLVQLEWNNTGSLLMARFETSPRALFVYSFPSPSERFQPKLRTVLLQTKTILHARWNPVRQGSLALCCGESAIYTWSNEWSSGEKESTAKEQEEEMAECIGVPTQSKFEARDIRWAPDGKGLLLVDKDTFCCAFEVTEDDSGQ